MTISAATMAKWQTQARLDTWHRNFVGSDIRQMLGEIERLRGLAKAMIENDPDDMAADGVTCLEVWRKEAKTLLSD